MTNGRRRGSWYPWIFVGMFAVVVGVNGALAYFATSTFNGLETERAYDKGLAYNEALAGAAAQEALGWIVRADFAPSAAGGHGGALTVHIADRAGAPLEGVEAFAVFSRPTQAGHDMRLPLGKAADGSHVALVELPFAGQWEVQVVANRGDASYQLSQRILLP